MFQVVQEVWLTETFPCLLVKAGNRFHVIHVGADCGVLVSFHLFKDDPDRLATTALERIWRDGHRYAKAGVMLNDFTGSGVSQLQLFDERPPRPHSAELMRVLDGINNSGLGKVWFAGRGMAPEWQMKREMLSPAYTTRWSDIPAAKLA